MSGWWPFGQSKENEEKGYALDNVTARQRTAPLADDHAFTALEGIQKRVKVEEEKQRKLTHLIKKTGREAKEAHQKGDKKMAETLLRKIGMYKKQRAQKDGIIQNLLQQELAMDSAQSTVETAKAMKHGAESMHRIVHTIDNELDVNEVAHQMQEAVNTSNQMADLLGQPFDLDIAIDGDDSIEAQLAEWDDENDLLGELEGLNIPETSGHHSNNESPIIKEAKELGKIKSTKL